MSTQYGTVVTTAGAEMLAACILAGTRLPIVECAVGDGGGAYYEPTTDQTGLVGEKWRGDIAGATLNPNTPNMLDVKIVVPDTEGGYTVREAAVFAENGTMVAVCNLPDTEKVAISGGVSGKLTLVMHIVVADASVVEFTINPSLDVVSPADLEAAISEHNASNTCHADIRQLALNSMQHGDAYTKAESDELLASGIYEHNNDAAAHPAVQVDLTGLDSRIKTLELKFGTNVNGNSFEVTFVTLTGLVVTGVWNEPYARVEF